MGKKIYDDKNLSRQYELHLRDSTQCEEKQ